MTGVALVAHHQRESAAELARTAAAWCARNDIVFWMPPADAEAVSLSAHADERPLREADLVLSLGGDGTMLRSVRLLGGAPVPLLGVDLGTLGYLTEVEADHLPDALDRFFAGERVGEWHLDERMLLDVSIDGGEPFRALNEVIIEKGESAHTVRLLARLDGVPFTHYAADGLMVATPTGSTAYSLSARGPIVSPRHRAMLLTPVSPHMLFDRSLVLDPSEVVEIEVAGNRRADVAIDGQHIATLHEGDVVRCTPAAETARFVRFGAYHYHQILKAKFGLADR
jgi:NAD+ kinase